MAHHTQSAYSTDLLVRDLGRMPYGEAFELQKRLQRQVIESRKKPDSGPGIGHLLLVEHDPPVITISRRPGARRHLTAGDEQLRAAGVEVAETNRGGDITYHGPGQLVVYPILDLNVLKLRLHSYMRFLEQVVIDTLAQFGIAGVRDECATGVWVRQEGFTTEDAESTEDREEGQRVERAAASLPSPSGRGAGGEGVSTAKICAMGVRVSRWVSMHGLALNVTTNLDHFDLIVPCGLAGRTVTSLQRELGEKKCPTMGEVKAQLCEQFSRRVVGLGE